MKANVNFEFGSEELQAFASNVMTRAVLGAFGSADPAQMQAILTAIHQSIGMGLQMAVAGQQQRGPMPPPWSRGYAGPPQGYGPPGPYGPTGPIPSAGPGPYGAPDPSNVRPIRETAHVDRCFAIEATRNTEAGWRCHGCATFNGTQRTVCRYCGHTRCDAVITPPPEPEPTPETAP